MLKTVAKTLNFYFLGVFWGGQVLYQHSDSKFE